MTLASKPKISAMAMRDSATMPGREGEPLTAERELAWQEAVAGEEARQAREVGEAVFAASTRMRTVATWTTTKKKPSPVS